MRELSRGGILFLDPRMRLFIVLLMSAAAFWMTTPLTSSALLVLVALLMFASGVYKTTLYTLLFYAVFLLLDRLAPGIENTTLSLVIVTLSYFIQKCTTVFMLGALLVNTTTVTEVICALETLRVPNKIIIPFAVAIRFIPSIREDFSYLKDSLRVRNINVSFLGFLKAPVVEYMLVPILIRSYKTSDELAAAAMARGLDNGKRKTILYALKFRAIDFLILVLVLGFSGVLFCLQ